MKRRITALVLTLLMMFSLLGNTAVADTADDSITVYVSAAENGEFITGTDDTKLAYTQVEITGNEATIEDAFVALHDAYYDGGSEAGYQSSSEGWVTTFWGKSASYAGYLVNGSYAMSTADSVSEGDYIVFWFYQDLSGWSDAYTSFDSFTAAAEVGEAVDLTLTSSGEPLADAQITVNGTPADGKVTDHEGKAELSFESEGRYIISAVKDGAYLVPPVCIAEVTSTVENPADIVSADKAALTLPAETSEDISLPLAGQSGKTQITWSSSDESVITSDGLVTVSDTQRSATLTAEITYGDYTEFAEFDIIVKPQAAPDITADSIMENIARSFAASSAEWYVMDMAAYSAYNPEITATDKVKQDYIDTAIKAVSASDADEATLAKAVINLKSVGIDPTKLYKINSNKAISAVEKLLELEEYNSSAWVAPYTLAALNQGDYDSDETEGAVISAVIANQGEDGAWNEWDDKIQTTSNVIAGLAFYYHTNEEVRIAVDKAVAYLSSVQKDDGSFDAYGYGSDSNTQAMVVIALSSLGIDADTDARFIKDGVSVYDALMKYALPDASGFGYTDNTEVNSYSTEQGFRALVAYSLFKKNQTAYNIYDYSASDAEAGRVSSSGSSPGGNPSAPDPDEESITVYFTLKSDDSYWIRRRSLEVAENATVYDAFVKACDAADISYTGADKGYVTSITKGRETLSEFGKGVDSGWMYKVNDEAPDVGLKDYRLEDGDDIVWFYTVDWSKVPGSSVASSGSSSSTASARVKSLISKLGEITLESEEAIANARLAYDSLTDAQKKLVTNYDALTKAEETLRELKEAMENKAYFQDTKEHANESAINYMYEKGIMNGTSEGVFEPESSLTRAMFAVVLHRAMGTPAAEVKSTFADVKADFWYADAVAWASEEGIIVGVGESIFAPERCVTAEEAALILARLEAIQTDLYADAENASPWAAKAVTWAVEAGIADSTYAPTAELTRAQCAQIIANYLELYQ